MTGAASGAERHSRRRVVLATGNQGKVRELQALLGQDWEIVPQSALGVTPVAESGASFLENALIKARHAAAATSLPAIADDSGLEVDALGGKPGVRSARYAGPGASDTDNLGKLLAELADVPEGRRTARFRCVMVFVAGEADPAPVVAEGVWEGRIALSPRGSAGFGYDPVFEDPALQRTAAELSAAAKNERSHRGQAARRLRRRLWAGALAQRP